MKRESGIDLPPDGLSSIDSPTPITRMRGTNAQTAGQEFDFLRLARILLCRWKLIIAIAACGAMAAGIIGLLIAPKYTATARIVVEPERAIGGRVEAPLPTDQLVSEIDTHMARLSSPDHLRRALDSLSSTAQSSADPGSLLNETVKTGIPANRPLPAGEINRAVRTTKPTDTALTLDELSRRLKIWLSPLLGRRANRELDEQQRRLRVIQERTSRIISISFTAKSPGQAAAVANRVVQLYVNDLAEQGRTQANQELTALDTRAGRLKSELDKATEVMGTLLSPQPPGISGTSDEKAREARLHALEREAASTGQAYAGVLEREKEIRDRQGVFMPDVRILSLASPPDRPSSVNPILFIFPALIVFLIGGSLLAIMLERLDRGLRSERDVTDVLGLPCIGLVPRLPRSYTDRPFHYLQNELFTPFAESIRSSLATLNLVQPDRKSTTILISSSVHGEGKTTVAASLSVYAARLGKRVLLVDFDSRHPSVKRTLRGPLQAPVSDLQDRPLEEMIHHLPDLHFDYLAMPHGKADPLAPFIGKQMQHLLQQLRESYDCVFIDGPPLLGITETRLLAGLVDSVILVIKWGDTRREVVQNAGNVLHSVLRSNGRNVLRASTLLTQVDLRKHAAYRDGDVGEAYAKYGKNYFPRVEYPKTIKVNSRLGGDKRCEARVRREYA